LSGLTVSVLLGNACMHACKPTTSKLSQQLTPQHVLLL